MELANNGGYFSQFKYMHDDYNAWVEDLARRRKDNVEKREQVHGKVAFKGDPVNNKYRIPHKHVSCFNSD